MSNWYDAYDTSDREHKPDSVVFTDRRWVRVRKDFEYIEGDGEFIEAHWHFMEKKIAKEDWEIFQSVQGHDVALDDVYSALTELAGIIVGGE